MTGSTGGEALQDADQVEGDRSAAMDDEDEARDDQDALHANEGTSETAQRAAEEH